MKLRNAAKKIPLMVPLVRLCRNVQAGVTDNIHRRLTPRYNEKVFENIYTTKKWLVHGDSVSGDGSTLSATVSLRQELPVVCRRLGIRSLVDAPCGDFLWMREIVGCFEKYTGIDVVAQLISQNNQGFATDRVSFVKADITSDPLPAADAVLCRDCFIHLSTPQIWAALRNFKKAGYRYIMLTQDEPMAVYEEIVTGGWRPINWRLPPFAFPNPVETIVENTGNGRLVAIWETGALKI